MKTALLVIATGERYRKFAADLLTSARTWFVPHTPIVFADDDIEYSHHGLRLPYMKIPHEPWPGPTLHRYRTFVKAFSFLRTFDQLFYIDADMRFVDFVGEEIFSDGITATLHPGYIGTVGTPERRDTSGAYIPAHANNKYYCGGFNGGDADSFLTMAVTLAEHIEDDHRRGLTALWHDESHLNRFLYEHPPAKELNPSYCYPEHPWGYYTNKWAEAGLGIVRPRILALEKK